MKNILELCLSKDLGGLELYMVRASHFLHDKLNCVSVINQDGKLQQYYKDKEYKYEELKNGSLFSAYATAKNLAKIIDDNSIDVLHLHWTKDIVVAVLAKLLSNQKPKLVQTRNMTMTRFKDDFYHRFLYKNMDMMLAVTHQVKEQIQKFVPNDIRPNVEVLYMGADTPEQISQDEKQILRDKYNLASSFTVGLVGRIEEGKGQYLLIDAIKELNKKDIDAKALLVGHAMSEEYLDSLKDGVKKDSLEDKVIFTGFTTEVQKLMQVCDVVVLATDSETFGLVLIEAMHSNIAVVATNNSGPLEIIEDGKSGLLFKVKDSKDLADKLESLYKDESLKKSLADAGKNRAIDMFSSDTQFEKLKDILEKL